MDFIKFMADHVIIVLIINGLGFSFTIWLLKKYVDTIFKKIDEMSGDLKETLKNHAICKMELPEKFVRRDEFNELRKELRDFREEICGFNKNLEKDRNVKWMYWFMTHSHAADGSVIVRNNGTNQC